MATTNQTNKKTAAAKKTAAKKAATKKATAANKAAKTSTTATTLGDLMGSDVLSALPMLAKLKDIDMTKVGPIVGRLFKMIKSDVGLCIDEGRFNDAGSLVRTNLENKELLKLVPSDVLDYVVDIGVDSAKLMSKYMPDLLNKLCAMEDEDLNIGAVLSQIGAILYQIGSVLSNPGLVPSGVPIVTTVVDQDDDDTNGIPVLETIQTRSDESITDMRNRCTMTSIGTFFQFSDDNEKAA